MCGALLAVCYNPDTQVQLHLNICPCHGMQTRPIVLEMLPGDAELRV